MDIEYKKEFEIANSHYYKNEFIVAIKCYDELIKNNNKYYPALYQRAQCFYKLKEYRLAAQDYLESYRCSNASHIPSLLMSGRSFESANLSNYAVKVFESINMHDIDEESMFFYLWALIKEGMPQKAQNLYSVIKNQKSTEAIRLLAKINHDLGKVELAKKLYENLESSSGYKDKNCFVKIHLFFIYLSEGKVDRAFKLLASEIRGELVEEKARLKIEAIFASMAYFYDYRTEEFSCNEKYKYILDSAEYFKKYKDGLKISPAVVTTFDLVKPFVSKTGLIAEFGVRNGHSINHIAKIFSDRTIYGFDSFEGLPEQWGDLAKGAYTVDGRLPQVRSNVKLIKGWFEDSLPKFIQNCHENIAFLNVDCDLYSSTATILENLSGRFIPGSIIIFDEYIMNENWREDEYKAFQEWIAKYGVEYEYLAVSFYTKQVAIRILGFSESGSKNRC